MDIELWDTKRKKKEFCFQNQIVCALCLARATWPPLGRVGFLHIHHTHRGHVKNPAGPLPCLSMAFYSLHCVVESRACDGKGKFLLSHSGHWPFCESILLLFPYLWHPIQSHFKCELVKYLFQKFWPRLSALRYE